MITQLSIVTAQGANTYWIGKTMDSGTITSIEKKQLYINGDAYEHYCGFDETGKMLFSVNCLAPCEIIYKPVQP